MKANRSSLIDGTYNKIVEELESGNYTIGTKLQPIRTLAKKFNVSYMTAQKAILAMQYQGTLKANSGDGLYVVGKPKPLDESVVEFLSKQKTPLTKNTASKRTHHSLGVVMPYWLSSGGSAAIYEIVRGLVTESDKLKWAIELIHNENNESELPAFVNKIYNRDFKGVVWLQPAPWHKMNLMRLVDLGSDVVVTGRHFKDIPVECVSFDHQDMAKKVADFFFDQVSATQIGVFTGPIDGHIPDPYSVDIVNALMEEFKKRGHELPYERICQAFLSQYRDLIIEDFIKKNTDLEGMICLHEALWHGIERMASYLNHNKKISLIDVSGVFNKATHCVRDVNIIEMRWPLQNIGKAIVKKFCSKWSNGDDVVPEPVDLSVELCK